MSITIENREEVTPEFSVESRRVDYSLRLNHTNEVFLEVKKTGEDLDKYQEQLLDYSFRQGVELAILTNGTTWWFYLPTKKGDWKARKFYTIDVIQQESHDVAQKFIDLLSKANVQTGKALQHAESIYNRLPILKALIEKGGNSTQQQVYEIIEKKMGHSFNKLDLQILKQEAD